MKIIRQLTALAVILGCVSACGYKGPLYLEKKPEASKPAAKPTQSSAPVAVLAESGIKAAESAK